MNIQIRKVPVNFINIFGKNSSSFVIKQETNLEETFTREVIEGKLENLKTEIYEDLVVLRGKYRCTKGLFRNLKPEEIYVQIPIIGAKPHMKVAVSTHINFEDPTIEESLQTRKVYQFVIINFDVTIYEEIEISIVSDIKCNDVSYQKELITLETPLIKGEGEYEKELILPEQYQYKELLTEETELIIGNYKITEEGLDINGRTITRLHFIDNEEEIEEYVAEEDFSYSLPLKGIPLNCKVIVDGKVKLHKDSLMRDGILKQRFNFTADAYSNNTFHCVTHFSGNKNWDVTKKKVTVETVLAEGSSQTILNRNITIEKDVKSIGKSKANAKITDIRVIPNKVIVSGVIDKEIFYTEEGSNIVRAEFVQDTFSHFVHLDGVYPGAHTRATVRVEYINHSILEKRVVKGKTVTDIRQTVVIEIKVFARKYKEIDFVADLIPVSPITYHHYHHHYIPSKGKVIRYTVVSGDSLWKIARRYNTTIEAILAINHIPNPDRIDVGQVILVPVGY
ncbi:DUF3794 and LysM peptidoglycan-binding domain-containing protein [Anaerobranca gottschalkii]|uniref:LysM domain-containing protein n=1 Tax=Anaerobranca gottschalkii DSM 13577 TaxID=1120990 RepID=A0A1I0CMK4_9FIRM|nr:LysM peptidoglycan-binding domain-containing protein [Anaerobranca gottschalkii]SET20932.1 protein of unknown function [Anaerobranca gottschalkii DSM 13577]